MGTDTDFSNLAANRSGRARFMHFNPEISVGSIGTIITIIGTAAAVWGGIQADRQSTQKDIEYIKQAAAQDRLVMERQIAEIKATSREQLGQLAIEVKEIQKGVTQTNERLLLLGARQPAEFQTQGRRESR